MKINVPKIPAKEAPEAKYIGVPIGITAITPFIVIVAADIVIGVKVLVMKLRRLA